MTPSTAYTNLSVDAKAYTFEGQNVEDYTFLRPYFQEPMFSTKKGLLSSTTRQLLNTVYKVREESIQIV